MRYLSPLRYPGGKAKIAPFLARLIREQQPSPRVYAEPFAGGAGAALALLIGEHVDRIRLNDFDAGIAAFWRAVVNHTEELANLVQNEPVTLDAWHRHRERYTNSHGSDIELGFSTFFLNRTNRSGILRARPIGGLDQTGQWKIDARFNRDDLAERIRSIGRYGSRISVTQLDVFDFLSLISDEPRHQRGRHFLYVDPPYLLKSEDLYLDTLSWNHHKQLARFLRRTGLRWLLTYDVDPRVITDLYPGNPCVQFAISHTAARQHVGDEYAVFSKKTKLISLDGLSVSAARWVERGGNDVLQPEEVRPTLFDIPQSSALLSEDQAGLRI